MSTGDDTALLAAFSRWIEATRRTDELSGVDSDQFNAAVDVVAAIIKEISAIPAATVTGMAVKVYLDAINQYGGKREESFAVALPEPSGAIDDLLQRSLLTDAMAVLPVLAVQPAVDPFTDAVADISASAEPDLVSAIVLKAGAKAAGVTVAQARTVWATMAAVVAGPAGVAA